MKTNCRNHRWMAIICCVAIAGCAVASEYTDRKLNPYHKQQLQAEIQKAQSKVLACTGNANDRCERQQELCQKLIQAERFDDALEVAKNIYQTPNTNAERRAAHHYLIAEIYSRKMDASPNLQTMEQNRELAIRAAQDVIRQNYTASWGVTEHAQSLIRGLNDQRAMADVKSRVAARQGGGGAETSKEAMARQQRAYLDATCARTTAFSAPVTSVRNGFSALKETSGKIIGSVRHESVPDTQAAQAVSVSSPMNYAAAPSFVSRKSGGYTPGATISQRNGMGTSSDAVGGSRSSVASLPSSPQVSRSVSSIRTDNGGRVTFSQAAGAAGLKGPQQPNLSQVADSRLGQRAPIVIGDGMVSKSTGAQRERTLARNLDLGLKSQGTMFGDMDGGERAAANSRSGSSDEGRGTYALGQVPK